MRGFSFTCRKKMTLTRWVAFTSCFVFEAAMENGYGSSPSRAITLQANCIPCQTMSQNDAEFLSLSSQIEKVWEGLQLRDADGFAPHNSGLPADIWLLSYLGLFQAEAARDTGHAGPTCWTCRRRNASRFVSQNSLPQTRQSKSNLKISKTEVCFL